MTDFSPLDSALHESTPEKIAASLRYLRKADAVMAALMPLSANPQAPSANVTPMRQPRADLARLVDAISAAVYANGDGLSVTEAIGALELAKLELLKEQEQ